MKLVVQGSRRGRTSESAITGDTAKEGSFHGPHRESVARSVDEEVADVFIFRRRGRDDVAPSSGGDQEENFPHVNLVFVQDRRDVRQLVKIRGHHRRVDLYCEPTGLQPINSRHRRRKVTGNASNAVVCRARGPIHAE